MNYNNLEKKLIKDGNISFIKMLIEKDIKSYKYEILNEDIVDYVHKSQNIHLYNTIKNCNITDDDLKNIQLSIIKDCKYNLDIEYLPTEDWEFNDLFKTKELVIDIPSYEMISNGLALFILIFPFAALFLSYFLIMIFR